MVSSAPPQKRKQKPLRDNEGHKESHKISKEMKAVRKDLNGDNGLKAVKDLLVQNQKQDIFSEYIEAGGSLDEIFAVLNKGENNEDLSFITPIFDAAYHIILVYHTKLVYMLDTVEEACLLLVRSKPVVVNRMLQVLSPASCKKIALRLLTAMVTVSPTLGREILASVNLRSYIVDNLAKPEKEDYEDGVRISYIRFIMSFFIDNDVVLIKQVLQNRHLLFPIASGLVYDSIPTVEMVLTTLLEKVIKLDISKTLKLYAMNTVFLRCLLTLYKWLGPRNIIKTYKEKKRKQAFSSKEIDEDGQQVIQEMVHTFLVAFLTSRQAGLFHDPTVGTAPGKYMVNSLSFSILKSLPSYWEVCKIQDLAISVLTVCPELIKPTLQGYEELLHLKVEESKPWMDYIEFIKKVIAIKNEDSLPDNLDGYQLATIVMRLSVPTIVFTNIASGDSLLHRNSCIRHQAVSTLLLCFKKLQKCITKVQNIFPDERSLSYNHFHRTITKAFDKDLFCLSICGEIWSLKYTDSGADGQHTIICRGHPDSITYYSQLIDLFLEIIRILPHRLNTVLQNGEELGDKILKTVNLYTDTVVQSEEVDLFRIKCIKFICKLKAVTDKTFEHIIETLIKLLNTSAESKTILADVLKSTGLFDNNRTEVYAWACAFDSIKHYDVVTEATTVFVNACSYVRSNIKGLCHSLNSVKQSIRHSSSSEALDWSALISLCEKENEDYSVELNRYINFLPEMSISPLVPAFLITIKESKTKTVTSVLHDFLNAALGFITFNQVNPNGYYTLLKQMGSKEVNEVKSYVSLWITKESDRKSLASDDQLKSLFQEDSIEVKVMNDLLSSEDLTYDELFQSCSDETKTIMLVKMVVFCTSRLVESRPEIEGRAVKLLHMLFTDIPLSKSTKHLCLRDTILHPTVMEKFKPLSLGAGNLTSLALYVVSLIEDEKEDLIHHYRKIFILDLISAMNEQVKISKKVMKRLKLFPLRNQDVLLLTKHFTTHYTDGCKNLGPYLLTVAAENYYLLPDGMIKFMANIPKLQPALTEYFRQFPHQLVLIKPDVPILDKEGTGFELATLLLKNDGPFTSVLLKRILKKCRKDPKFVFSALAAVKDDEPLKKMHMQSVVAIQVDSLMDILIETPHPEWLLLHRQRISALLDLCLDDAVCKKLCSYLIDKIQQISVGEVVLDVTGQVFTKCKQSVVLVQSLLAVLVQNMKSRNLSECETLCAKLVKYVCSQQDCDWSTVCTSAQWVEWSKLALKYGEDPSLESAFLLATLSATSAVIMKHNKEMVASLCEMVFSHSQFLKIMLGHSKHKDELVSLLFTLLEIDSSTVLENHIPVFLSAYELSLGVRDQQILKLLQIYENKGVRFQKWKPFMWGEAAVSHYSVYSIMKPTNLQRDRNMLQCLDHLNQDIVNNTITHFPCQRSCTDMIPPDGRTVYDPAFYIPLFISLLAPGESVLSYKFLHSGALALTIAALSLSDDKLRQAAYVVISRLYNHLQISPQKKKDIWLHFLNALRGGVIDLMDSKQKNSKHVVLPRLSSVVTVFFARAVQILANTSDLMYTAIANYILVKKHFNLSVVPEFLTLIHSKGVKHEIHRKLILQVLRDGVRDTDDLKLCSKSSALKFVMDFYSTITPPCISDHTEDKNATLKRLSTKVLILEIIVSCTKLPNNSQLLLEKYGLLSWLSSVIQCYDFVEPLVSPVMTILLSVIRFKSFTQHVTELLFILIRKHQPSADQMMHIVHILHQYRKIVRLTETNVKELIEFVSSSLDKHSLHMQRCKNILIYGADYQLCVEEPIEIVRQLRDIVLIVYDRSPHNAFVH